MQPFVIAVASASAEDSDTVACVTDQCRTVKHGPIVNTRPDVEHLFFWVSSPVCIHGHMDDVVQLSHPREIQYTSLTSFEATRDLFFLAVVGPAASLMISFVLKAMSKRCSVIY